MMRLKQFAVIVFAVCCVECFANIAQAQCTGCAPERLYNGGGINYFFNYNVGQDLRDAFTAAAARWNAHFQENGLWRRFNSGCCFEIKVDPNIDSSLYNAFWYSGSGISFSTGTNDSPNQNLKESVAFHELGHQNGWGNRDDCDPHDSVMAPKGSWIYDQPVDFTGSDACAFDWQYQGPQGGDPNAPCPGIRCSTPILIDVDGGGFRLTAPNVQFDLGNGPRVYSWPESDSMTGFLVMDRDGDGLISDGRELFGDATHLGWGLEGPVAMNGFEALAVFDRPENGGDGDGLITYTDAVYSQLRMWFDRNHNGHSDPGELVSLDEVGIVSISLAVKEGQKRDRFGNLFRYRSVVKVRQTDGTTAQRFAYDVYLVSR